MLAEPSQPEWHMCASCGIDRPSNPCRRCSSDTSPIRPLPLGAVGRMCVVGDGLQAESGLVLGLQGSGRASILVAGGRIVESDPATVVLGETIPGLLNALSPGGALVIASDSPDVTRLRLNKHDLLRLAVSYGLRSQQAGRLLAFDALRQGYGDIILRQLPLSETEKRWLGSVQAAQRGDWGRAVEGAASLPPDGYWPRIGILLSGLREVTSRPDNSDIEIFLATHRHRPLAQLLAMLLGRRGETSIESLMSVSPSIDSRVTRLLERLRSGESVLEFSDLSPAIEAYDALTSSSGPVVRPELLHRKSRAFIDDVVDRGRIDVRRLPDYRSWLTAEDAAYFTARIDPQQLDDEEVQEYGPAHERERRAFNRGDLKGKKIKNAGISEQVATLDAALRGDVTAYELVVRQLIPEQRLVFEGCMQAIAARSLPDEITLGDLTTWEALEREVGAARICETISTSHSPLQRRFAAWTALRSAKRALHAWNWTECRSQAGLVLRNTTDELLTDEALNLIAAAHWQRGQDEAAGAALEKALEGNYTAALQSNAVLVAGEAHTDRAAELLLGLMNTAPSPDLRISAAKRCTSLWNGNFPDEPMPKELVLGLRDVLPLTTDIDEFTVLADALATNDTEWFAKSWDLNGSAFSQHPRAQVLRGKAKGIDAHIEALAEAARTVVGSQDQWVTDRRDWLLADITDAMLNEEDALWAASLAYQVLDANMPMARLDEVRLTLLAAREFTLAIDTDESCLSDKRVDAAVVAWSTAMQFVEPDRSEVALVAANCMDSVIRHLCLFYYTCIKDNAVTDYDEFYGSALDVAAKVDALRYWAGQACQRLGPMQHMASSDDTQRIVDILIEQCVEMLEA